MEQINTKQKGKTSKMVSFRMPAAYIDRLKDLAEAKGISKSKVLLMGLDALQSHQNATGGQQGDA